jgi:hypothetical protein
MIVAQVTDGWKGEKTKTAFPFLLPQALAMAVKISHPRRAEPAPVDLFATRKKRSFFG